MVLTRLCVYLHQQKPHKATESVQPKERCILQLILIRVSSGHLLLCVVHDKYGTRNQNFFSSSLSELNLKTEGKTIKHR